MKKLRDSIQYAGDFELKQCTIITHQGAEVDLLPNLIVFPLPAGLDGKLLGYLLFTLSLTTSIPILCFLSPANANECLSFNNYPSRCRG